MVFTKTCFIAKEQIEVNPNPIPSNGILFDGLFNFNILVLKSLSKLSDIIFFEDNHVSSFLSSYSYSITDTLLVQ
jgi:hypothetical protein